jgi:hypothetical protein
MGWQAAEESKSLVHRVRGLSASTAGSDSGHPALGLSSHRLADRNEHPDRDRRNAEAECLRFVKQDGFKGC